MRALLAGTVGAFIEASTNTGPSPLVSEILVAVFSGGLLTLMYTWRRDRGVDRRRSGEDREAREKREKELEARVSDAVWARSMQLQDRLDRTLQEALGTIERQNDELRKLRADAARLRTRIAQDTLKITQLERELKTANGDRDRLTRERDAALLDRQAAEKQLASAQERIRDLEREGPQDRESGP